MELIYVFLFGIVVAAIRGLLGIAPENEPEKKENSSFSFFSEEDYDEKLRAQIDEEICGIANHGHGLYKSR